MDNTNAVAWTVVGLDGKTSIGGWLGMHSYEASLKYATLRDGHSYAFAYHPDAEIDRLRAENEALRAGIAKALDEIEDDGPKAMKYAAQELRTALEAK